MYFILVWKSNLEKCTTGGALLPARARSLRGAQHEARRAAARGRKRGGAAVISPRGEWLYQSQGAAK